MEKKRGGKGEGLQAEGSACAVFSEALRGEVSTVCMGSWWANDDQAQEKRPTMPFPWPGRPCTFCFLSASWVSSLKDIGNPKDSKQRRTSSRIKASSLTKQMLPWVSGGSCRREPFWVDRIQLKSSSHLVRASAAASSGPRRVTHIHSLLDVWEKTSLTLPSVSLILKMTFKLICFAGCLICERGCKLWVMSLSSSYCCAIKALHCISSRQCWS